jgi:hypothetical protein
MDSLTETFCLIDDFCRAFEPAFNRRLLANGPKKRQRRGGLSLSELMTLAVLFHPLGIAYRLSEDKPALSLIRVNTLVNA